MSICFPGLHTFYAFSSVHRKPLSLLHTDVTQTTKKSDNKNLVNFSSEWYGGLVEVSAQKGNAQFKDNL